MGWVLMDLDLELFVELARLGVRSSEILPSFTFSIEQAGGEKAEVDLHHLHISELLIPYS